VQKKSDKIKLYDEKNCKKIWSTKILVNKFLPSISLVKKIFGQQNFVSVTHNLILYWIILTLQQCQISSS